MKILSQRKLVEETTYTRFYERKSLPGSGYSFPCDSQGVVDLADVARTSYVEAQTDAYIDQGPQERVYRWREPATGECEERGCRRPVALSGFTNTCECGADYNMSGHRLAPREQWGEETGESASDILRIDAMTTDECFDNEGEG